MDLRAWALSAFVVCAVFGALGAVLVWGLQSSNGYGNTVLFPVLYAAVYIVLGYAILRGIGWLSPTLQGRPALSTIVAIVLVPVYLALMFGGCVAANQAAHALTE